ncbi:translocation/assembly module TamB domain-containing protein [Terrimonas pollutisoli]|uniref:translocation/assembly module TamB domain-containing protein n=1 Tax=Terrimonas pollutisoli TaxID=3034147 RepID=UPI0023ED0425|nr:translocation/assembly module TamB domain-containing protein [Terrimonas sp. H1YJ31]
MQEQTVKQNTWKRVGKFLLKTVMWIFFLILLIFILILTPPVQSFIRKKVVTYLENRLDTRIEVGRIYIGLPKNIVLENIYVEDRQKDTLLSGKKIKADLDIWRLITKNEVDIRSVSLNNITAKVKRQLPDTIFNFQFIIDAFATKNSSPATSADTSTSAFNIGYVELNKIRILYNDVITGSDMEAWLDHLDTRVKKFDPAKLLFDVPKTNISGLIARVYQIKPLAKPEPEAKDIIEAKQPNPLELAFNEVNLEKIKLDFKNDVSATYATIDLGQLNVQSNNIDLDNRIIDLENIVLNKSTTSVRLGKKQETKVVIKEVKQEAKSQVEAGWHIQVKSLDIADNNFQFDNDNNPKVAKGMDYAHLKADALNLKASNILLDVDSMAAKISKAGFKEKSGFVLNDLQIEFLYTDKETYLHDLYLETPGTELKRSATIRYESLESLKNDIGNMYVDFDLQDSKVSVKDVLTFMPELSQQPAFAYPGAVWYINSRINGRINELNIDELQLQGLRDTKVDIAGKITGLPAMKNMVADLNIRNISSSKRDMDLFIPQNILPATITLPSRFNANGAIKGNNTQMNTDLAVNTDLGNSTIKGRFSQLDDPKHIGYNAKIDTRSLQLGTIIQDKEMFGPVSASVTAKGMGFDPKTVDAAFDGIIHSAYINQYTYKDVRFNGNIANQKANINAAITDPNIHLALNAKADLSKEFPGVQVTGMIDSLKLQPLHFATAPVIFRGKVDADFPVSDPNDLQGKLLVTESVIVQNNQRLQLDTIQVLANRSDKGHSLQLQSDVMSAMLEGQYRLTDIGTNFQQAIQPYFAIGPVNTATVSQPYDFTLNAYVLDNPALKVIIPSLQRIDSVSVQSRFTSQSGWSAKVEAPALDIGPNKLREFVLNAGTGNNAIRLSATAKNFSSGKSIVLDNTTIHALIANNNIDFALNIKDRQARVKYNVKGLFQQPTNGIYQFAIKPDSLLLNYDAWSVAGNNKIIYGKDGINASNFILSKNGQKLTINSVSSSNNAPMDVIFDQFKLATLTGFVNTDSTFADGTINGKITFNDLAKEPVFIGDLTITDLSIKTDTVGNVKLLVNNQRPDVYSADIALSGRGNNVKLTGDYFVKPVESNFDFLLDIKELPMATAQAFSDGMIKEASGSVNGKFTVKGTMARPLINGDLHFNKTEFNYSQFNNRFSIDQEKINVTERGFRFDRFAIKDSAGNSLIIDGIAGTDNFINYNFDMRIRANDFRILNSTKKDNKIFYGKLYINTNMTVKGTEEAPAIDGRLVVNDKTNMTVVIPQREPGVVDREGIVEFVDMDQPVNDSLFLLAYDSLNTSPYTGMDITTNIEVEKEATFSIIIDEGNGDFLNVKGEALLVGGIDPSGKVTLTGSYELEEGTYNLSFNFIRRKFNIQKGSKIIWEGAPTEASVDIEAIYVANTAPLDLVKNQLDSASAFERNTYLQKLPFDVHLKMEGELLKPQISFDIILPENKSYVVGGEIITNVRTRLDQLRQDPGEMNKQVFSLLLLNRFMADNPFQGSGEVLNPSMFARQSVSKLLTEQLNRLAENLVAGVDLNFDVLSSEDYTTGQRRDRTDLNVGLSKQLLNDRLTVSVGSNFELEGPQNSRQQSSNIAGNVALDYRVSRDNRYLLRAYRKNEYQGVIDGYIIETGVAFIITVDYNKFREIFISVRERQKRREQRRKQRELEMQQKAAAADSTTSTNNQ